MPFPGPSRLLFRQQSNQLITCLCLPTALSLARRCHLTRDTGRVLRDGGYDASGVRSFDVEGLGILAPHLAGIVQL
jgi:hypothetical protein